MTATAATTFWTAPTPAKTGIGLRQPHHGEVIAQQPAVGWLEAHTENHMYGGQALAVLDAAAARYPISLHGVGLSLGSADPLDEDHLTRIRTLVDRLQPALVSEHLSWSGAAGVYLNDLLPLPYTEEVLSHVCDQVETAQEAVGRPILVENPSTYLRFADSQIPEWEFLAEVSRRTGCGLLLDLNNIVVAKHNHGYDPETYIRAMPAGSVGEFHLAGHAINTVDLPDGSVTHLRIDDHGAPVDAETWALYRTALDIVGDVPALIEWDTNIPDLAVLVAEAAKADAIRDDWRTARQAAE